MTVFRSLSLSILAIGVVLTLSTTAHTHGGGGHSGGGHESHHSSEHHESHHSEHHGEHHGEHHEGHHEEHHGEHHDWHHDDHHGNNEHRGWYHEGHHEEHHGEHNDEHRDWPHDDHHAHDDHRDFNHHDWYKHEWWHHQTTWHNHPWHYWWHRPTTNEIAAWSTGWGLTTPVYYDYGPDGNVVYRNNDVYVNGGLVGPSDAYAKSVMALADAGPTTDAANDQSGDWLPLGTFAVLPPNGDNQPNQTLQLAIDKSGNVSGVLFDLKKNTSTPIRGSLDRTTQRLAFDLGPKSGLVAETGLYNLTKDKVTMAVHKGLEKPQTYTLARFDTPPANTTTPKVSL